MILLGVDSIGPDGVGLQPLQKRNIASALDGISQGIRVAITTLREGGRPVASVILWYKLGVRSLRESECADLDKLPL